MPAAAIGKILMGFREKPFAVQQVYRNFAA